MPTITFQQGVNGYSGTIDTMLRATTPTVSYGGSTTINVDSDDPNSSGAPNQYLIEFSNIFGNGPGQIPLGSTISSAILTVQTFDPGDGAALHRMLTSWADSATWSSLVNGVQADGVESVAAADRVTGWVNTGAKSMNVLGSLQAWSSGAANDGWVFIPSTGGDGWKFYSADSGATAPTLTVTYTAPAQAPNAAPVLVAGGSLAYTENDLATAIAPGLTVSDADSASLAGATVRIASGYAPGEDSLIYTPQSGVNGSWDAAAGVLTLSGPASVAQYQAALDSVKYVNSSDNPSTADRTIAFQVDDGAATNNLSAVATSTVRIAAVNDAPTAVNDAFTTTRGAALTVAAASGLLANDVDPDNTVLAAILGAGPAHGALTFNPDGSFVYTPDSTYTGVDGFTYKANDGSLDSNIASVSLTIDATGNVAPVVVAGGALSYVENDPPAPIAPALTVSDSDSATLVGASVQISGGYAPAQDALVFVAQNGISGAWNVSSGTLTLTGAASVAQYQAALESVSYANSSDNPTTADRTISFQVNDGASSDNLSAIATTVVHVQPVNDPPLARPDTATVNAGSTVKINVLANDADPEGAALTVSGLVNPAHGTAAINPDQSISYSPLAGYAGADSFDYTILDPSGASAHATVSVTVSAAPPAPVDASYVATTLTLDQERDMQHDNASKSFFFNGDWWAVLPDGGEWKVHRFTSLPSSTGQQGGWAVASGPGTLLDNNRNVDIAWDDAHQKLYVLQYYDGSSKPVLSRLGYDAASNVFTSEAKIQLAGSGGKLTGAYWSNNNELALGLDDSGNPLVAAIGTKSAPGLHLAYGSSDLSTWSDVLIDSRPVNSGGNSKVDFVDFTQNGVPKIGLAYASGGPIDSVPSSGDGWMFASHAVGASTSSYASGWTKELMTNKVAVDNHISVGTDGQSIFVAMKDNKDAVWMEKGVPGAWDAPVLVTNGGIGTSRPTLVVDDTNDRVLVFYQQSVVDPYGSIYGKSSSAQSLSFDPASLGTKVMQTYSSHDLIDPQGPAHAVTSAMDGQFFMFAKDQDGPKVWYDVIHTDTLMV